MWECGNAENMEPKQISWLERDQVNHCHPRGPAGKGLKVCVVLKAIQRHEFTQE